MFKLYKLANPSIIKSLSPLNSVLIPATRFSNKVCGAATTGADNAIQRQNFHPECEAGINKQVNMELYASYVYLSMATHFDRDDVALPGFRKMFADAHKEEITHAQRLIDFQNMRGGRAEFFDINKPKIAKWGDTKSIVNTALQLEMEVNQSLLDLSCLASSHNDLNLVDFLDEYLMEQVRDQKKLADLIKNVERVGEGLGIYELDRRLLKEPQHHQPEEQEKKDD